MRSQISDTQCIYERMEAIYKNLCLQKHSDISRYSFYYSGNILSNIRRF